MAMPSAAARARNTDARCTTRLADGATAKKNFNIFYEIDGEEVGSVLRADEYGGITVTGRGAITVPRRVVASGMKGSGHR